MKKIGFDESAPEDSRTRDLVARSILENGPTSAAILAKRLGFTPAGVRRHLDALVSEGLLEAREPHVLLQRGRGRPSKVFVMTDVGREKFEHSYDDLAISALKFLASRVGEESLMGFAQSRAADIERALVPVIKKAKNSRERVDVLASFLTAEGYAANVLPRANGEELCQHHCPIAHVAAEFPQLCEAETQAFSRLLGTHVQRLATIAHGDGVCTTYIPEIAHSKHASIGGNR
ncbi:MAG: transcriptional regulator [Candidatus Nanopelagicaceae bacterium]|nr:transcriptional regulator [Candidatus Nanopelagicaceae bacterium]